MEGSLSVAVLRVKVDAVITDERLNTLHLCFVNAIVEGVLVVIHRLCDIPVDTPNTQKVAEDVVAWICLEQSTPKKRKLNNDTAPRNSLGRMNYTNLEKTCKDSRTPQP